MWAIEYRSQRGTISQKKGRERLLGPSGRQWDALGSVTDSSHLPLTALRGEGGVSNGGEEESASESHTHWGGQPLTWLGSTPRAMAVTECVLTHVSL
jgi:hypothetical protein